MTGFDPFTDDFPQPLGTGHLIISEKDIAKTRKPRKRQFPFGFVAPYTEPRYTAARNRHRNTVPRRMS